MPKYIKYFIPWLKCLKTTYANRKEFKKYSEFSKLVFSYPTLKQFIEASEWHKSVILKVKARKQYKPLEYQ